MAAAFGLMMTFALIAIPVGLIWPKAILWRAAQPSRLKAAGVGLAAFVVVAAVTMVVMPVPPKHAEQKPAEPPAASHPPAAAAAAFAPVTDDDIFKIDPNRQPRDDRIIHIDSESFALGIKLHAPRLTKTGAERRGEVVVETWVSAPSRVRLVLDTLPSQEGIRPGSAGVIRAVMERPLADKPSPYDGGLAKTIDAFAFTAAPDWPMTDQKAFVGDCLMTLLTAGCDRTVKGIRIVARRYGPDAFKMEAYRP